jgi:hypothetical protein
MIGFLRQIFSKVAVVAGYLVPQECSKSLNIILIQVLKSASLFFFYLVRVRVALLVEMQINLLDLDLVVFLT